MTNDSKLLYRSLIRYKGAYVQPALLLVSSSEWTRPQIEVITRYAFESIKVPGFSIIPNALAAAYAYGLQDALIIDIGKTRTEITPVLDFGVVDHAQRSVRVGGDTITDELHRLRPDLTREQCEELKRSPVFEVLSEDDSKNSVCEKHLMFDLYHRFSFTNFSGLE